MLDPLDASTPRTRILDELKKRLGMIHPGTVLSSGTKFLHTVRAVYEAPYAVTSLDSCQTPCWFIFLDETTSLSNTGEALAYTDAWPILLGFMVRDDRKSEDPLVTRTGRLLEAGFYDLKRALHLIGDVDPCTGDGAGVSWALDWWKIDYYDAEIGFALAQLTVRLTDIVQ